MGSSEKRRAALVKSGIVDHVIILFGFWFFLFDMTTLLQVRCNHLFSSRENSVHFRTFPALSSQNYPNENTTYNIFFK